MVDSKKLDALIEWMKQSIGKDLLALLVVDRDGLIISSGVQEGMDETVLGGMAALVEPVLKRISSEFSSKSFGTGTFDTDDNRLIFCEAGPKAILVLVVDPLASIDTMFPYAYLCAEKVARIIDGRPVSPVVPNFIVEKRNIDGSDKELKRIIIEKGSFVMKTILGGDGGVGKTTLVHQFIQDKFDEDYKSTIGVSIMKKAVVFDEWDVEVRLTIFDLAGQSQFARVRQTYFSGAKAGLIVFDTTRKETFESVDRWINEARRAEKDIMLMLVGNKIDLEENRQVSKEEGEAKANQYSIPYFETSALNKDIVDEAFNTLSFLFIRNRSIVENLE